MQAAVRRRVRVLAGAGAIAAATLLTSCAAGQSAQTAYEKPTLDGTSANIGRIAVRGLAIEAPVNGTFYPPGTSAQVRMTIVNNATRDDRLTSISGSVIGGWSSYDTKQGASQIQNPGSDPTSGPATASRSVTIPSGLHVSYGTPQARNSLLLMKLTKRVFPGTTVQLTFTFANAGSKTVTVPVSLSESPNSSIVPGPSPSGGQAG